MLETLVKIAQVNSFSAAAQAQNMTLSALSMQMKALETDLNVTLFDRSFRPPLLTPLGRRIADQAEDVIRAVSTLRALSDASATTLTGSFQIGFIQSASARILPRFIKQVRKEASAATFRYRTGLSESLTDQVAAGHVDAAVVTQVDGLPRGLHWNLIASEPMALAIPMKQAHLSPEDLANALPFVHFRPSTGIGKLIAGAIDDGLLRPRQTLRLDGIEACMECVKEGVGYTMLPLPDIRRYADARLRVVEGTLRGLTRNLVLLTRDDTQTAQWRDRLLSLMLAAT